MAKKQPPKKSGPVPGAGKQDGTKTPITQDILVQAGGTTATTMSQATQDAFFSPGNAIAPQAQKDPSVQGRRLDYQVNINTVRQPKAGEGVTFAQMRGLADGYDLLRLVIETRKDQMGALEWGFKPKDEKAIPDARCKELNDFFMFPDQEHDWDTWLRMLLEELFVTDAVTVYPRENLGGGVYGMDLLDGSTIQRLIDGMGRTPIPPEPAYQQILKGMPAIDYSRDELIYRPRNARTHRLYGYSPVEQIIMTVNIALRRQVHQLQFYTEGNIPEALLGVPEDWNPDQIAQFQAFFDSVLEGNTAQRRKATFIPGGVAPTMLRPDGLKDEMDEWLARIVCFAFSISPQAMVKAMNRATADTAKDQALAEGLVPIMNWTKNLMNFLIWKFWGYTDLTFDWIQKEDTSPLVQAQVLQILTGMTQPLITIDEAREKLGMEATTQEQMDELKPPPPPALDPSADPNDPNAPPGKPGAVPPKPGVKAPPKAAPGKGGTAKPVGKSQKAATKKVKPLDNDRKAVQASISAIKALFAKALATAGKRIAGELANAVGKAITVDSRAEALLTQLTFEELQDLAPDLADLIEEMTGEAGEAALAQVLSDIQPEQLEQVNSAAVDYAKDRSATLVTDLEDSTREMLRATLTEGIEQGWSADTLADEIADSYGFSDERAETIARTETAFANVQGNIEGWTASGVVESKEWVTQGEVCDECDELDGKVVGLDEDFPDAGDGPPLHPNCRCDVLPVLSEDTSAEEPTE